MSYFPNVFIVGKFRFRFYRIIHFRDIEIKQTTYIANIEIRKEYLLEFSAQYKQLIKASSENFPKTAA